MDTQCMNMKKEKLSIKKLLFK